MDGVILSRTVENDALVDILYKRGIPFATIGSLTADCRGKAAVEADHDQVGGCRAFAAEFLHVCPGTVAVLGNDMNYIVNQSRIASNFLLFGVFCFPLSVYKSLFHSPSAEVQITARSFSTPLSHWYALYIL